MEQVLNNFIFFFAVIDPIGTVPVFLAVTAGYDTKDSRKIALQAILTAKALLVSKFGKQSVRKTDPQDEQ